MKSSCTGGKMLSIKVDNIEVRLVEVTDAGDIVRIRTAPQRDRYINPTPQDIEFQQQWITEYKKREIAGQELFFVFLEDGLVKGTYRLGKINRFSLEIGSWVFERTNNKQVPKIADILMSDMSFNILKRNVIVYNVIKENERVWKILERKGHICISEDDKSYYFVLLADAWRKNKADFLSFYQIDPVYYERFHTALQMAYNDWPLRGQYELKQ